MLAQPSILSDPDDESLAWKAVAPVWNDLLDAADQLENDPCALDGFTAGQRASVAAMMSDREICNGGFAQYFWNSTGILFAEAIEGFRRLTLPDLARCLERAATAFPGGVVPLSRGERQIWIPVRPTEALRAVFDPIEEDYYAARSTTVDRAVAAYVRRHPAEFVAIAAS